MGIKFWAKTGGLLCLFLACVFGGMEIERRMKRRWQFFLELQELFAVLEKEMIFHHTAVSAALRYAAGGCRTLLRELLLVAVGRIEAGEGVSFEEIWKQAVDEVLPERFLNEAEREAVYRSAHALCSSDTMMQRTLLLQNQERFAACGREAEREYREKGGLVRRLMTAAGAFLVILLI